jgi:hypothetical protein
MRDTTNEAAAVADAAIKRMNPVDRLRQSLAYSETMRNLAIARLRAKHPDLCTLELVELLLGERLVGDDRTTP